MRIFSVPQDERSGALQLSVLLLPAYALGERCGGGLQYTESGIKDCSACLFPHRPENYDRICARFAELAALCRRPPEKG